MRGCARLYFGGTHVQAAFPFAYANYVMMEIQMDRDEMRTLASHPIL
jgi:hypothetical protein